MTDIIINENSSEIKNYKCFICFETIDNINKKKLYKLCICKDSLICNDCEKNFIKNKIKKCPICKQNLNIKIKWSICNLIYNSKYLILHRYISLFYLLNIILINISLYICFYKNSMNDNYPTFKNYNFNNTINSYHDIYLHFIFYKPTFFSLMNIVYLFNLPILILVLIILNNFDNIFYTNRINLQNVHVIKNSIYCLNIIINLTTFIGFLLVNNNLYILVFYVFMNILLYFGFILLLVIYLNLKYVKYDTKILIYKYFDLKYKFIYNNIIKYIPINLNKNDYFELNKNYDVNDVNQNDDNINNLIEIEI